MIFNDDEDRRGSDDGTRTADSGGPWDGDGGI